MIALDRKMPKSCWTCHFAAQPGNSGPMYCFTEADDPKLCAEDYMDRRPWWCPLQEVPESYKVVYAKGYAYGLRTIRDAIDSNLDKLEEKINDFQNL